jgi:hypothetical protein
VIVADAGAILDLLLGTGSAAAIVEALASETEIARLADAAGCASRRRRECPHVAAPRAPYSPSSRRYFLR